MGCHTQELFLVQMVWSLQFVFRNTLLYIVIELAALLMLLIWQICRHHWFGSSIDIIDLTAILTPLIWQLYWHHWFGSSMDIIDLAALLTSLIWQLYWHHHSKTVSTLSLDRFCSLLTILSLKPRPVQCLAI